MKKLLGPRSHPPMSMYKVRPMEKAIQRQERIMLAVSGKTWELIDSNPDSRQGGRLWKTVDGLTRKLLI